MADKEFYRKCKMAQSMLDLCCNLNDQLMKNNPEQSKLAEDLFKVVHTTLAQTKEYVAELDELFKARETAML